LLEHGDCHGKNKAGWGGYWIGKHHQELEIESL